jgi:hypothetical protein
MTFRQLFLWHSQYLRIVHKIPVKLKDVDLKTKSEIERINEEFFWDEKNKRYVGKKKVN